MTFFDLYQLIAWWITPYVCLAGSILMCWLLHTERKRRKDLERQLGNHQLQPTTGTAPGYPEASNP